MPNPGFGNGETVESTVNPTISPRLRRGTCPNQNGPYLHMSAGRAGGGWSVARASGHQGLTTSAPSDKVATEYGIPMHRRHARTASHGRADRSGDRAGPRRQGGHPHRPRPAAGETGAGRDADRLA